MSAKALDLLMVGGGLVSVERVRKLVAIGSEHAGGLWTSACVDQALPILKQRNFDAILMAMAPAGASALEAISALELTAPETPVLALAASPETLLGEMVLRSGADDCLFEPDLDGQALFRAIRFARERRRRLANLVRRAWTDALTGLPNRALLADRLANMVARAKRHDTLVGVLFIDLDGFKQVNDSLGHAAGDLLLQRVAERLTATLREGDTVARVGGDEFVVAVDNLRRAADAESLAANIQAQIEHPFRIQGNPVQISASIGIAFLGQDAHDTDGLLRHADAAMYRAKRARATHRAETWEAVFRPS
jgi:diguanylate cyclase (GGDEF)-like protein